MEDTLLIDVQRYCRMVNEHGLEELTITGPDVSISLSAMSAAQVVTTTTTSSAAPTVMMVPGKAPAPVKKVEEAPKGYVVPSPLVGIFYRQSSPDTPSFVEVGDTVTAGQTIGIVEAMKVFNEITTDKAGTVIAIPAENGKLVQADQPLVILDVLE
jgi:acetyl-CoA carboxylase biotin carboxyl carrier protein